MERVVQWIEFNNNNNSNTQVVIILKRIVVVVVVVVTIRCLVASIRYGATTLVHRYIHTLITSFRFYPSLFSLVRLSLLKCDSVGLFRPFRSCSSFSSSLLPSLSLSLPPFGSAGSFRPSLRAHDYLLLILLSSVFIHAE